MILTTRGRYAVMAILDLLADNCDPEYNPETVKPVSLLSIAKRQNISLSYLEQIFANLRKADIVKATKGPGGGYLLKRKPAEITIADIMRATGENIKMTSCGAETQGCAAIKENAKGQCKTHDLWFGLEQHIHQYLSSISLQDFCKK